MYFQNFMGIWERQHSQLGHCKHPTTTTTTTKEEEEDSSELFFVFGSALVFLVDFYKIYKIWQGCFYFLHFYIKLLNMLHVLHHLLLNCYDLPKHDMCKTTKNHKFYKLQMWNDNLCDFHILNRWDNPHYDPSTKYYPKIVEGVGSAHIGAMWCGWG